MAEDAMKHTVLVIICSGLKLKETIYAGSYLPQPVVLDLL